MGSSDVSPAHVPAFVVPLSTAALGIGFICWNMTYITMVRRSLQTRSYSMPLISLACNLSWEMVYAFYVAEMPLEKAGFCFWLLLDVGLVYTTIRFASLDWEAHGSSGLIARHVTWILALTTGVGIWGHYAFAAWWLDVPGRGHGDKAGKWWGGQEGFDTTELAYWSAGFSQLLGSATSLAMLMSRGHSGGVSYSIWFVGSIFGMGVCNGLLWYWWPEAHGYFVNPLGVWMCSVSFLCDLAYPFVLHSVRTSEVNLPDGRLVAGNAALAKIKSS